MFYRGTWFPILISMCILIAGSYLLGRAFCGWVCPVGFLVDLSGIISRFISKIIKRKTTTRRFGLLQYGILATVILLSFISMQALSILDPFVIFRRSVYMVMNAGVPEVLLQGYTPVLDFSKNKCVFCGACEAKCPVKQKAIIVTNYGEKRRDA